MSYDDDSFDVKIRAGLPLAKVSDMLGISRPSFYKYVTAYKNRDFDKIPPSILTYFKEVDGGRYKTADEAEKALKQLKFLRDAEIEAEEEAANNEYSEIRAKRFEIRHNRQGLPPEEIRKLNEELDREMKAFRERHPKFDPYKIRMRHEQDLLWNDGEIRSAVIYGETPAVILDVDFDDAPRVTVEQLADISGTDVPVARFRASENTKVVYLMNLGFPTQYLLKWRVNGEERTAGPFPLTRREY